VWIWRGLEDEGGVCVALFCWPDIGESLRSRCHSFTSRCLSLNQGTWGGRILTLHLTYVAGYTDPHFFLFERTQQLTPLTTRCKPWRLRVWADPKFVRTHQWGVSRGRTGKPGAKTDLEPFEPQMTIRHRMTGRRNRTDDLRNNSPSLDRWAKVADIRSTVCVALFY